MRKIKWCVYALISLILLHYIERAITCKEQGLKRAEALEIANWKLKIDFGDSSIFNKFKLKSEDFQWFDSDPVWGFEYQAGTCEVVIIIDKCGTADIGGLTKDCPDVQPYRGRFDFGNPP